MQRREFVRSAAASAMVVGLGPAFWRTATATASTSRLGPGPYGPLGEPNADGLRLPAGFSSRVVYRAGTPVAGTTYTFPPFPDGAATYPTPDGGWIHVVNSEIPGGQGGVSAVRYDARGTIVSAQRILGGTSTNCAGGTTPWGTWLSCEEVDAGRVFECDPTGATPARVLPALGVFKHEAACVDPLGLRLYLTEDEGSGNLYRFTPRDYPSLEDGLLEVAVVAPDGAVRWMAVPDPAATSVPTRQQVPEATRFRRGEGIWYDRGIVYVATTSDATIHAYDTRRERISVLYRQAEVPGSPLQAVDNITVSPAGDLYVCEDGYAGDADALDVCVISREGEVARFCKLTGPQHGLAEQEGASEVSGVAFTPDGSRMYFSSQRGFGQGVTYEVSGPFRTDPPPFIAVPPGGPAPTPVVPADALPLEPAPTPDAPRVLMGLTATRAIRRRTLLSRGVRVRFTVAERTVVRMRLVLPVRTASGRITRREVADRTLTVAAGTHTVLLRVREKDRAADLRALSRRIPNRTADLRVAARTADGARSFSRRAVRVALDAESGRARR